MNHFGPARRIIIHLDNASYHKKRREGFDPVRAAPMDIIFELVNNSPPEFDFSVDDFLKDNGDPVAKTRLIEIYKAVMPPEIREIEELAHSFNAHVVWTPPYWPEQQPVELWNQSCKQDYRDRAPDERGADVGEAVLTFCDAVSEEDVQGYVEFTDKFCIAVDRRETAYLNPLVVALLPDP